MQDFQSPVPETNPNEFETELQRRNSDKDLFIRNLCKEGDTPAFRPHPSRKSHWVIPNGKSLVKKDDDYLLSFLKM